MKTSLTAIALSLAILSCNNETSKGKFTVSGEIKNVPDQQIFLDQLYFSQKNPEILDTAQIKNGKFELSAVAAEEGLYRIRLEKMESGFIFINDKANISLIADINDRSLEGPKFNSPANIKFKNLLINISSKSDQISELSVKIDSLEKIPGSDSIIASEKLKLNVLGESFAGFITRFIDTTSDPVVAMFALGYTRNIDPARLKNIVPGMQKRFPNHQGIASIIIQYNQMMAQQAIENKTPKVGSIAPDFTLNDTNGKPISLNQLKGKYVLVDFWASWCGPCRSESPYLVAAYNKFKNKNFTILGVSLDDNKNDWLEAIKEDKFDWQQVSDLKGMDSPVGDLYGFSAIPYNVLIDPQGKIIAAELRGETLEQTLGEILK